MGLTAEILSVINDVVLPRVENQIDSRVRDRVRSASETSGDGNFRYGTGGVVW